MIAEYGLAALWIAAALSLLQIIMGGIAVYKDEKDLVRVTRAIAALQALMVLSSFLALVILFIRSDMSVALVAQHSHTSKPLIFKVAGSWGNHEGSMLLWVTVLAVSGAGIALFERVLRRDMLVVTLAAQAVISIGFYAFILLSSNPFLRLDPAPIDGLGLNPLLQDIGLAFHPPTLYFGYVGLSIAFSFAVAAMILRDAGPAFARAMRPWVLGAWIFLTIGIAAGSYWAYYELGWGGWWFWDPVENASLMPWLAATALLHSVNVLAARDGLRSWTLMLAVVAFSMSMLGTFLVRSGILTSVHAFAVDPERGSFILILLAIYIGGALALFGARVGFIAEGNRFTLLSREFALVLNNLLLSGVLAIILFGTLYPIMAELYFDAKVSVGPPYFNLAGALFIIPMLLVMAAGPLLRWRRDDALRIGKKLLIPSIAGLITLAVIKGAAPGVSWLSALGFMLAGILLLASVLPLIGRKLRQIPLALWGMVVAHFGMAIAILGMATESSFTQEKLIAANVGEHIELAQFSLNFKRIEAIPGPNWTALAADIEVSIDGGEPIAISPQNRRFAAAGVQTSEAALLNYMGGQLYVVLGEEVADGRWQLRIWWKPLVTFIWIGGLLIAFGGLLALIARVKEHMKTARIQRNDNDITGSIEDEEVRDDREGIESLPIAGTAPVKG